MSELFLRNERSPTQRTRLNIDEGATIERERGRLPNWPAQFVTLPLCSVVVVRQLPGQTEEGRREPDEGAFVISCADDAEIRPK